MAFAYSAAPIDIWAAGIYEVQFDAYEEIDTKFGPALRLQYRSVEDPTRLISELANMNCTPNSKLTGRVRALSGASFDALVGHSFELDTLLDKRVMITVSNYEKDGQAHDRIEAAAPVRQTVGEPVEQLLKDDDLPF